MYSLSLSVGVTTSVTQIIQFVLLNVVLTCIFCLDDMLLVTYFSDILFCTNSIGIPVMEVVITKQSNQFI